MEIPKRSFETDNLAVTVQWGAGSACVAPLAAAVHLSLTVW